MSYYTCPYCFTKVNPSDIWFQCAVQSCVQQDEVRTRYELDIEPSQKCPQPYRNYNTFFRGQSRDVGECPKCQHQTSIRVCANCHSAFPSGIEGLSNTIIAVVGARETGKSHYIAVLIQILKQLNVKFDWTISALNDETIDVYRRVFFEPLYLKNSPLLQTKGAAHNTDVKKPLLYSLHLHSVNKIVILAFFDSAGEDLENVDNMKRVNKYIASASGIILLLDPLLVPSIRSKIHTDNLPDEKIIAYHIHIIDILSNFLRTQNKYDLKQEYPIPLAVTFSKIDLLRQMMGEEFDRFTTPIHHKKNILNLDSLETNGDFIKNWLITNAPELLNGTQRFTKHQFFGISTLGSDPRILGSTTNPDGRIIPGGVKPMHVEDPFLWLLYANNLIPGR